MDPTSRIEDGTAMGEVIARLQPERDARRELERLGALAPTNAELSEAAEQMDAGLSKAWPELFDGLGADPEPDTIERLAIEDVPVIEIDDAVIGRAADKVAEFRAEVGHELHHLGKYAPRRIHIQAQAVAAQCDDFLDLVRAYFMEQGSWAPTTEPPRPSTAPPRSSRPSRTSAR
jgi:hypothetical protein